MKNGVVIKVNPSFEQVYGISVEKVTGMTVFQLEEEGYFTPSIIAIVLRKKRKTMPQKTRREKISWLRLFYFWIKKRT